MNELTRVKNISLANAIFCFLYGITLAILAFIDKTIHYGEVAIIFGLAGGFFIICSNLENYIKKNSQTDQKK